MRCRKCGKEQAETAFYYNRKTCKKCVAAYVKNWSELNRERRQSTRRLRYIRNREYEIAKCAEYRALKKATDPDYAKRYAREYYKLNRTKIFARLTKWREKNKERLKESQRRYRLSHPDKMKEYRRSYAAKNRSKVRAHWSVKKAIKSGKMSAPDACFHCGVHTKLHAHHPDYSQKRTVEWLCPKCHSAVHAKR